MFPWIWYWAPVIEFPFSGDVVQDIEPDFFSRIKAAAGDPEQERRVFGHASYGKQLGIIMEAVLSLIDEAQKDGVPTETSHQRLRQLHLEIEEIKAQSVELDDLIARLDKLKRYRPRQFARLQAALQQTASTG